MVRPTLFLQRSRMSLGRRHMIEAQNSLHPSGTILRLPRGSQHIIRTAIAFLSFACIVVTVANGVLCAAWALQVLLPAAVPLLFLSARGTIGIFMDLHSEILSFVGIQVQGLHVYPPILSGLAQVALSVAVWERNSSFAAWLSATLSAVGTPAGHARLLEEALALPPSSATYDLLWRYLESQLVDAPYVGLVGWRLLLAAGLLLAAAAHWAFHFVCPSVSLNATEESRHSYMLYRGYHAGVRAANTVLQLTADAFGMLHGVGPRHALCRPTGGDPRNDRHRDRVEFAVDLASLASAATWAAVGSVPGGSAPAHAHAHAHAVGVGHCGGRAAGAVSHAGVPAAAESNLADSAVAVKAASAAHAPPGAPAAVDGGLAAGLAAVAARAGPAVAGANAAGGAAAAPPPPPPDPATAFEYMDRDERALLQSLPLPLAEPHPRAPPAWGEASWLELHDRLNNMDVELASTAYKVDTIGLCEGARVPQPQQVLAKHARRLQRPVSSRTQFRAMRKTLFTEFRLLAAINAVAATVIACTALLHATCTTVLSSAQLNAALFMHVAGPVAMAEQFVTTAAKKGHGSGLAAGVPPGDVSLYLGSQATRLMVAYGFPPSESRGDRVNVTLAAAFASCLPLHEYAPRPYPSQLTGTLWGERFELQDLHVTLNLLHRFKPMWAAGVGVALSIPFAICVVLAAYGCQLVVPYALTSSMVDTLAHVRTLRYGEDAHGTSLAHLFPVCGWRREAVPRVCMPLWRCRRLPCCRGVRCFDVMDAASLAALAYMQMQRAAVHLRDYSTLVALWLGNDHMLMQPRMMAAYRVHGRLLQARGLLPADDERSETSEAARRVVFNAPSALRPQPALQADEIGTLLMQLLEEGPADVIAQPLVELSELPLPGAESAADNASAVGVAAEQQTAADAAALHPAGAGAASTPSSPVPSEASGATAIATADTTATVVGSVADAHTAHAASPRAPTAVGPKAAPSDADGLAVWVSPEVYSMGRQVHPVLRSLVWCADYSVDRSRSPAAALAEVSMLTRGVRCFDDAPEVGRLVQELVGHLVATQHDQLVASMPLKPVWLQGIPLAAVLPETWIDIGPFDCSAASAARDDALRRRVALRGRGVAAHLRRLAACGLPRMELTRQAGTPATGPEVTASRDRALAALARWRPALAPVMRRRIEDLHPDAAAGAPDAVQAALFVVNEGAGDEDDAVVDPEEEQMRAEFAVLAEERQAQWRQYMRTRQAFQAAHPHATACAVRCYACEVGICAGGCSGAEAPMAGALAAAAEGDSFALLGIDPSRYQAYNDGDAAFALRLTRSHNLGEAGRFLRFERLLPLVQPLRMREAIAARAAGHAIRALPLRPMPAYTPHQVLKAVGGYMLRPPAAATPRCRSVAGAARGFDARGDGDDNDDDDDGQDPLSRLFSVRPSSSPDVAAARVRSAVADVLRGCLLEADARYRGSMFADEDAWHFDDDGALEDVHSITSALAHVWQLQAIRARKLNHLLGDAAALAAAAAAADAGDPVADLQNQLTSLAIQELMLTWRMHAVLLREEFFAYVSAMSQWALVVLRLHAEVDVAGTRAEGHWLRRRHAIAARRTHVKC